MDNKSLKKLEQKVKKPDFAEDYSAVDKILSGLSILGNIASIFLASFFINGLLSVAIDNEIARWVITIVSLSGLELMKREIFKRFSRDFIRTKKIFTGGVLPMLIFTMVLISLSFYSSLSGAQKFSSKADIMENVAEQEIDTYSDSINILYQSKIEVLEQQNSVLFEQNLQYDREAAELPPNWISAKEKIRKGKKDNNDQIEKNESRIKELKSERDELTSKYKKEVITETSVDVEKNKSDSNIFIWSSTLIEFLILIGIYFNNLYSFRSFRDIKNRLLNDDNFRTYHEYSEILDMLFLNRKAQDTIPSIDLIIELLVMNKVYLTKEQVEKSFRLFDALKIIETNGEYTYLLKDIEESTEIIKKHFHVE